MFESNCNFQSRRYTRIMNSKATMHALKRSQQRGVQPQNIGLIIAFGEQEHDGQGAIRYLMSEDAMQKVYATLGKTKQIIAMAGTYAVVSAADNAVITVGHRYT